MTRLNSFPTNDYLGYYYTDGTKYYFGGLCTVEGEVVAEEQEIMWRNLRAAWYLERKAEKKKRK